MTTVFVTHHTLAMTRFVLATAVGSARQSLAIAIAVAAIGGAAYVWTHGVPAIGPGWATGVLPYKTNCFYAGCPAYTVEDGPPSRPEIPAAVLLGFAGFGLAAVIGGWRVPRRRVAQRSLPQGWR